MPPPISIKREKFDDKAMPVDGVTLLTTVQPNCGMWAKAMIRRPSTVERSKVSTAPGREWARSRADAAISRSGLPSRCVNRVLAVSCLASAPYSIWDRSG